MSPSDVRQYGHADLRTVRDTIVKRVSAEMAAKSYEDTSPPLPKPEEVAFLPRRDRGAGRPTKRERREMEKLRGRDGE